MKANSAADIGKLVAAARRHKNLTQAKLASEVGTTQTWISKVEQGKETAPIGKVFRLLTYLGVRLQVADAPWIEQRDRVTGSGPSLSAILESHTMSPSRRTKP